MAVRNVERGGNSHAVRYLRLASLPPEAGRAAALLDVSRLAELRAFLISSSGPSAITIR
jgi:hypothetical protein